MKNQYKPFSPSKKVARFYLLLLSTPFAFSYLQAADIFKANNTTALNDGASWVGGVVPGLEDIAVFDSTLNSGLSAPVAAPVSFGGIRVQNNQGGLVLSGLIAQTMTIGSGGFDLTSATGGTFIDIDSPSIVLRPGTSQTWSAAAGVSTTLWGGLTTNGATLLLDTSAGKSGSFFAEGFGTLGQIQPSIVVKSDTGMNFAALVSASRQLAPDPTLAVANPSDGGNATVNADLTAAPATGAYLDVVNSNGLASATAFRAMRTGSGSGTYWNDAGIRFNQPHATPDTDWTVDVTQRILYPNSGTFSVLVGDGVGARDVIFNGGSNGNAFRYNNGGATFAVHQHNTQGDLILRASFSARQSNNNFVKGGAGRLIMGNAGFGGSGSATVYLTEGVTQLGEDNATGTFGNLPIVNNGTLRIQRSDAFGFGSLLSGDGELVVAMSGSGNLTLSGANTYTGATTLASGGITLGSASALGASSSLTIEGGSLTYGAGVTADISIRPVTLNGATIIDTGANDIVYANSIGGGGAGGVTKSGTGKLTLSSGNTYTGTTTVTAGTLAVANPSGSATGPGDVVVATGATLAGGGTIAGSVTTSAATTLTPGNDGVGTLTVGGLSLASGSVMAVEFASTSSHDRIVTTNSGGLTINGGGLYLYSAGTLDPWLTAGTYGVIQYSGTLQGAGPSSMSVLNPQAGYAYNFGASGGFVTLEVVLDSILSDWTAGGSGSWNSSSNWSNGVPSTNYTALFNAPLAAPATITLDGDRTANGMVFSSSPHGYTIAQGTGGTLTLQKDGADAAINVTLGDHVISSPVALASSIAVSVSADASLTFSGTVSGAGGVGKVDPGLLSFTGHNTFTGDVNLNAGVLGFSHADSLGAGSIAINNATLRYNAGNTADVSSRITIGQDGAVIDTNGNDVIFATGLAGAGSLTKAGDGVLALDAAGTYAGGTIVTGGVLQVSDNAFLGPLDSSLTLNGGAFNPAGTLSLETSVPAPIEGDPAIITKRAVVVGAAGGTVTVGASNTLTLGGVLSGGGVLTKNGEGTLVLPSATAASTGGITLVDGVTNIASNVNFGSSSAVVGTGPITFSGGTLTHSHSGGNTLVYDNAIAVAADTQSTFITPNRFRLNSAVSGSGTLDVAINTNVARADFQNNFAGFSGNLNLAGTGTVRLGLQALSSNQPNFNGAGWAATTLSVDGVTVAPTTNSGGNTITIGALKSNGSTGVLAGGTAGAPNYTIGGKAVEGVYSDTTFGGSFTGNAIITKVGDGRLTLTGNGNVTSGALNANGGTLDIRGTFGAFYRSSGADGVSGNGDDYSSLTEPTDGQPWTLVQPGAVTVAAAGTLAGNGNLGGAITVNGALRPDSSGELGGQLSVVGSGSLALAATAVTQFDFNGANFTGVKSTSTGAVTYGGAMKLNFLGTVFSGSYQLFELAVAPAGAFTGVSVTTAVDAETALTDSGSGVWSGTVGAQSYSFNAATGVLTVTGGATAVTPGASTLGATAGDGQVDLSWTSATNADSYTVKRATTSGGPYTNVVSNLVGTSYSDTGLTNDTTYFYVVQATNSTSGLSGAESNEVSATPAASVTHTSLQNWRFEEFGVYDDTDAVLAGDTEDFDGDGLANLLEYAVNTDPTVPNASPVVVAKSGNFLTLTYPRRAEADAALTYTVQGSGNLTTGFTAATGVTNTVGSTSTYTDDVNVGGTGIRRFLRLSVTYTAP